MSDTTPVEPLDPSSTTRVADRADRYDAMLRLADAFDSAGEELRARSALGHEVLRDPAVAESADLSPASYQRAEDDIRAATTGKQGLLSRSLELDADALVVRATVLTYQWIDDLREAAASSLGAIAGRAIGYLAPNVALGGAIVSAGLIETDALDREGVGSYLSELAAEHPELMDHMISGGGGLLDGLQMRALLTAGFVSGESGRQAARGGLRALGVDPMRSDSGAAIRDAAVSLDADPAAGEEQLRADERVQAPRSVLDLMANVRAVGQGVVVVRAAPGRYIAYLADRPHEVDGGARIDAGAGPQLVDGDVAAYARAASLAIEAVVDRDPDARVLAVGTGAGGVVAAHLAAHRASPAFSVDYVVTAGAPAAQAPRLPAQTRMLALEDRSDPVALLGSLVNAGATNRTTVVFDASGDADIYVAGGRAADEAASSGNQPDLAAELDLLRSLGYLQRA